MLETRYINPVNMVNTLNITNTASTYLNEDNILS